MSSPSEIDALIDAGLELEGKGVERQVIAYFQGLVAQYPDHARVQFEMGGAYDSAGYEAEAIAHYERAIALGLTGKDAIQVNVQLGSSLRNIGKLDEAVALLKQACADHPDYIALR
ncbi:MAG TPA: tetratricopeptide repeat protein, partial [Phototrophicaceae bacterium]|nr:tetratricopeptide repeat protein [Phototrophicaceae bacterium]